MSRRGECQGVITLMKNVMKKVERCISGVDTFYKTEGMPMQKVKEAKCGFSQEHMLLACFSS